MTETVIAPATGTRVTLFAERSREDLEADLTRAFADRKIGYSTLRAAHRLLPSTCAVVDRQIIKAVAGLLDIDVTKALGQVWGHYREVADARDRTAKDPALIETVPLHTRTITSTYHPQVVITVEPAMRFPITFDLVVVYEIVGLAAVVAVGHVRSFEGGRCTATATLKLGEEKLATWSLKPDLSLVVPLSEAEPTAAVPEQR